LTQGASPAKPARRIQDFKSGRPAFGVTFRGDALGETKLNADSDLGGSAAALRKSPFAAILFGKEIPDET
jgi:hypothetical protein